MRDDIFQFFGIQRNIFGLCPRSGELFRLSDCKIYLKSRPRKDWMDDIDSEIAWLDAAEERLNEREEDLREKARAKGRKMAQLRIQRIDQVFTPRHLNPDDAKVIFHPVDYVVFKGMKSEGPKSTDRRNIQRSIEKVVEQEKYEWLTIRIQDDGTIREEG